MSRRRDLVDEVAGLPVAAQLTTHGDLVVLGVGPGRPALAVVEHQLHRRLAHRFARRRAVEDDIRHLVAAQGLGRRFPHHPAYGIDDVRLATAVRSDHAHQVGRHRYRRGVHERLEAGELDMFKPHLCALSNDAVACPVEKIRVDPVHHQGAPGRGSGEPAAAARSAGAFAVSGLFRRVATRHDGPGWRSVQVHFEIDQDADRSDVLSRTGSGSPRRGLYTVSTPEFCTRAAGIVRRMQPSLCC